MVQYIMWRGGVGTEWGQPDNTTQGAFPQEISYANEANKARRIVTEGGTEVIFN